MFYTQPPTLIGVSGVSGTGKSTLISNLEAQFPGSRVVTYTTRASRPGEASDAYHFVDIDTIDSLPDALWQKENYGAQYAVTRSVIETPLRSHCLAILPTITSHHTTLASTFSNVRYLGIHLAAPVESELITRMQTRDETDITIQARLADIARIEANAQSNPVVEIIPPNTPNVVLQHVLQKLESA